MGAADRSAAPRRSPQPGGCRSICSPQTICSAWGLQIDLQPPDHILSLGAAERSAAPRPYPQPGGCRAFCSPQTISSAWGLQIDLQPPDHILSLGAAERSAAPRRSPGAADRSAAPRRSAQPGGCRSICSPQIISSAWGLQIDLQPPDHLLSLGAADRSAAPMLLNHLTCVESSRATRRRVST
ncbi:hypothetical protein PGTUg99_000943 [Puccinia graminis f. sp. tritici]|uniref:Uncharacterized protein n=1 Tax=Puccinia graminis f. sp. tritici TaxID=56615 RepID=A0A5B0RIW5_PUCGR|nr:hypothetical protein PGTUg99_000943 [Puccinia graminis f. sp. tritici]